MQRIKQIKRTTRFTGRVAKLTQDTFETAAGQRFERETIHHPPSVVIVPILGRNQVVLIKQYRHAIGKVIYELAAGTREPGENLLACAKRELAEETGFAAKAWQRLCVFYPAPGISTERMALYKAQDLKQLEQPPKQDQDEMIDVEIVSFAQALKLVETNRMVDAKSMLGLIYGLNRIRW